MSASESSAAWAPGDHVVVRWMGELVEATVWQVVGRGGNGRPLDAPRYRLAIAGVKGHPMYEHSETERAS